MVDKNSPTGEPYEEGRFTAMLEYDGVEAAGFRDPSMFGPGRMTKRFEGLTIVDKNPDQQLEDVEKVEDANNSAIWGLLG
jgi:hypothetical protein